MWNFVLEKLGDKRTRYNILLSNGRFPTTIDLARQLHKAGHHIYVVDPMMSHVCKFSNTVRRSYHVPAPHVDAKGYIAAVKHAVENSHIDLIIPMHEEILFLAGSEEPAIISRLFAPPFPTLLKLHNKWTFNTWLTRLGLDAPRSWLVKNPGELRQLDRSQELAFKPVFGRAATNVYHLKPGEDIPEDAFKDVSEENHYIAQEWIRGDRFCTYSVVVRGKIKSLVIYPVSATTDGSSCVYFKAVEHDGIKSYINKLVENLGDISGQLAFDFIEATDREKLVEGIRGANNTAIGPAAFPKDKAQGLGKRLVAIECNPRATSGIHLYSGTSYLAKVFTCPLRPSSNEPHSSPILRLRNSEDTTPSVVITGDETDMPVHPSISGGSNSQSSRSSNEDDDSNAPPRTGHYRQVAPGMLMWQHSRRETSIKQYITHMYHLITTKDVMFSWRDIGPTLMQPFLLTSYYEICRERGGMRLQDMFQWDLTWEPEGEELEKARRILDEEMGDSKRH